jgi:hypothetical protein
MSIDGFPVAQDLRIDVRCWFDGAHAAIFMSEEPGSIETGYIFLSQLENTASVGGTADASLMPLHAAE